LGKIRAPYYRIVVADSRTKRDGRVIEEIGKYHPTEEPSFIEVQSDRAQYWLGVGAQPSPQVEAILKLTGDWGIFKGDKNAKSTVKTKEPKVEFLADEKKKPVLKPKAEKPAPKVEVAVEVAEPVEDAAAPVVAEAEAVVEAAPVAETVVEEAPVAEVVVEAEPVVEPVAEAEVAAEAVVEPEAVVEEVVADEAAAEPAVEADKA
jgi:small subunit ribosomal protein S16